METAVLALHLSRSIIVREEGGSKLILYSKGADSAIYPNLAHHSGLLPQKYDRSYSEDTPTLAELTQNYLSMYATVGLRTLCLARRVCFICNLHASAHYTYMQLSPSSL